MSKVAAARFHCHGCKRWIEVGEPVYTMSHYEECQQCHDSNPRLGVDKDKAILGERGQKRRVIRKHTPFS